jgi:hypothetical protein
MSRRDTRAFGHLREVLMRKRISWLSIPVLVALALGTTVATVRSQQRGGAANREKGGVGEIVGPYQLPDL